MGVDTFMDTELYMVRPLIYLLLHVCILRDTNVWNYREWIQELRIVSLYMTQQRFA